jgi:hypothetical protein
MPAGGLDARSLARQGGSLVTLDHGGGISRIPSRSPNKTLRTLPP